MASHFILELDTTPPSVDIHAPSYTMAGVDNDIEIVANEELSLYQEIYIIDRLGNRHDVIFSHETDRFVGIVNFLGFPLGISTIYAKVRDTVHNTTDLKSKAINIINDINDTKMVIAVDDATREIATSSNLVSIVVSRSEVTNTSVSNGNEYKISVSISDTAN